MSRFFSIVVFFRRHWWRFVLAFGLVGILIYAVWHIPDAMIALGRVGDDDKDVKSASSSDIPSSSVSDSMPVPPRVFIVCPSGLYTDVGYFGLGSTVGHWSLVGLDSHSGLAKWSYDNDSFSCVTSVRSGILQQSSSKD